MKKIAKLLKADLNGTSDLASIAAMLSSKGRGNDTLLAHITPREAEILKAAGGSGTTNPETGLLEFYDGEGAFDTGGFENLPQPATEQFGDFQPGGQTPEQVAAANQDLYPAGQVYKEGRTLFTPGGQSYNVLPGKTQEGIDRFAASLPSSYAQTSRAEDVMFGGTAGGASQGQALPGGVGSAYSPTGAPYTPRDLARVSTDRAPLDQPSTAVPTTPEKSFFDKLTTQDMVRLGLAGGLGIYGATQAKKGAEQARQAAEEQKAVGAPYQAKGKELIRAAESGELTPTGQQSLQALQARLAQGAESRGGVGAAQVAAQAEAYRQQLLSQQYNLGLQVSNIGDQIALGAIRTGLQADQALNQASTNFYTNLAAIGAGIPIRDTRDTRNM
jgi:hypothetical protein